MTVPDEAITAVMCLYLPVPPVMLWIHAIHARHPNLGARAYLLHAPVYIALVGATAAAHRAWTASPDNWPAAARVAGAVATVLGVAVVALTYREIDGATAMAVPQITGAGGEKLLERGIYGVVRHPRYAALAIGALAAFLLSGSTACAVAGAITIPLLFPLVRLEERELLGRFGAAYTRYRGRVPALVPRRRARSRSPSR